MIRFTRNGASDQNRLSCWIIAFHRSHADAGPVAAQLNFVKLALGVDSHRSVTDQIAGLRISESLLNRSANFSCGKGNPSRDSSEIAQEVSTVHVHTHFLGFVDRIDNNLVRH